MIILKNNYEIRGDVTAIFLNRKNGDVLETLIDTADLDKAKEFPNTWCATWAQLTQSFYCYGKMQLPSGERVSILLHRWLTDCPLEMHVDHFDNNTLNNRRQSNLRITTPGQNHQNRSGAQRNTSTGVRGVCWHAKSQKWQALIKANGKRKHLGFFDSIAEAESAVKAARSACMPFSKEAAL